MANKKTLWHNGRLYHNEYRRYTYLGRMCSSESSTERLKLEINSEYTSADAEIVPAIVQFTGWSARERFKFGVEAPKELRDIVRLIE